MDIIIKYGVKSHKFSLGFIVYRGFCLFCCIDLIVYFSLVYLDTFGIIDSGSILEAWSHVYSLA